MPPISALSLTIPLLVVVSLFHGYPVMARPAAAPRVAETTLHQAIDDAWRRLPQRNTLAAQQNVAASRFRSGSAFVPEAPTATGSYVDDRQIGSHYNYVTTQVGVSTPLWLPGEGRATQNLAGAENVAIEAQAELAHLALALQVLQRAVNAVDARDTRDIAARRLATSQALAHDLDRRFQVGEAAQSDALAAAAEAATAQVSLVRADAQLAAEPRPSMPLPADRARALRA